MNNAARRRLDDHDLMVQVYRLAERHVDLLEQLDAKGAEEKRELLRSVARQGVLDRILRPVDTRSSQ